MVVKYVCDLRENPDEDDRLQIRSDDDDHVQFEILPIPRPEGGSPVFLAHDQVAALVGQLTSWLERTKP